MIRPVRSENPEKATVIRKGSAPSSIQASTEFADFGSAASVTTLKGYELEIFYTNVEGEAIDRIYGAVKDGVEGLVMNPAGFNYAGYALRDCVRGAALPYVEVHMTNVAARALSASSHPLQMASSTASAHTATYSAWKRCSTSFSD